MGTTDRDSTCRPVTDPPHTPLQVATLTLSFDCRPDSRADAPVSYPSGARSSNSSWSARAA